MVAKIFCSERGGRHQIATATGPRRTLPGQVLRRKQEEVQPGSQAQARSQGLAAAQMQVRKDQQSCGTSQAARRRHTSPRASVDGPAGPADAQIVGGLQEPLEELREAKVFSLSLTPSEIA